MAIAFARPILFRRLVPSRTTLQTIKTATPAPPTQAGTIARPFNPFSIFRPQAVPADPFASQRAACIARGGRWIDAGRSSRCELPSVAAPVVPTAPEPVPVLLPAPAPVPKPGGCVECGAKPAPAPAPTPAPAFQVSTGEPGAVEVRTEATAPVDGPSAPPPTAPARKVSGAGLFIGVGVVVVLLAVASNLRPRVAT